MAALQRSGSLQATLCDNSLRHTSNKTALALVVTTQVPQWRSATAAAVGAAEEAVDSEEAEVAIGAAGAVAAGLAAVAEAGGAREALVGV